jgi:hypothetical protein
MVNKLQNRRKDAAIAYSSFLQIFSLSTTTIWVERGAVSWEGFSGTSVEDTAQERKENRLASKKFESGPALQPGERLG